MGKLHSLRRAIERDPESWLTDYDPKDKSYKLLTVNRTGKRPYAEEYNYRTREWEKKHVGSFTFFPTKRGYYWTGRYKSFLKHVLKGLGWRIRDRN